MQKTNSHSDKWSIVRKMRTLLAVYFIFLILDFTSSDEIYPHFVYAIMQPYADFWNWLVPYTGEHILKLSVPIRVRPNGSGDTTYNYVLQLLWIVFSIIIATIWTLADRRKSAYHVFSHWIRIILRYFLAYMLFMYGFVKVIKLQFPFPDLTRLVQPLGQSSPMGLAWNFIGYSSAYNIFIGAAEVVAGLLLFFKRTTLLGALLAIVVLSNVVAMNFAYDIPVKIFSLNLLFIAVWIAWYDKDRLISFLFLNTSTPPQPASFRFQSKWKKTIQLSLKTLTIAFALYATLWTSIGNAKRYGAMASKPPLYGIYDVQAFTRNKKIIPPLATDHSRWKRMIISYPEHAQITNMADSITWMSLKIDTAKRTLIFSSNGNTSDQFTCHYKEQSTGALILKGKMDADSIQMTMNRFDLKRFPLISQQFRWINEYPDNR